MQYPATGGESGLSNSEKDRAMTPPGSPVLSTATSMSPATEQQLVVAAAANAGDDDAGGGGGGAASASASASSSRRLFFGRLFSKVAASPLSPRRSSSKVPGGESWGGALGDADNVDDDLDVNDDDVDAVIPSTPAATGLLDDEPSLPAAPPPLVEWHDLPAHLLESIAECFVPENELTTGWKERAVSLYFFLFFLPFQHLHDLAFCERAKEKKKCNQKTYR